MSAPPGDANYSLDQAKKTVLYLALLLLDAYVLYQLKGLLICLIFALTIASAMAPIAEWAEKRKIPRTATVLVIYLATVLVYVVLGASLVPTLKTEGSQLYEKLPKYIEKVADWADSSSIAQGLLQTQSPAPQQPPAEVNKAEEPQAAAPDQQETTTESAKESLAHVAKTFHIKAEHVKGLFSKAVEKTVGMTAGILGLSANVILTLFLAAYFVIEANSLWSDILRWLPNNARGRIKDLIGPLSARLGGFVRGQLLVSLCVGLFLFAGFSLLGLNYALLLGLIAALLNLVPYVGSLIATGSAVLVALNQDGGGPMLAALVFGLYGLEQWLESSFIVPQILGKSVDLHPLVVLFSILIGGTLLGIAGALIAIPIASAGIFLAEEFYLKPMEAKEKESTVAADQAD